MYVNIMAFRIVWVCFIVFARLKVGYFEFLLVFVLVWFIFILLGVLLEIKGDLKEFWSELVELRKDKENCFKIQLKEQNPRKSTAVELKPLGRCISELRNLTEQKRTTGVGKWLHGRFLRSRIVHEK